ncbi:MAG: FkbM family methyltransferase [Nanoarchaeota archaeon]|nr:FkbM family methyltransferase [Nanoarchaeota archaeon]
MNFKKHLPKSIRESKKMKRLYTKYVYPLRVLLLKIMGRKINGRSVKKCIVKNHKIFIDVEDVNELFRADTYETKEPETLEWIETYFNPKDVFYDIGANIGQYSLFAGTYLNGDCTIYSFEPAFHTYAKLNWNIHNNGLDSSIIAYNIAVSNKQELNTFYLSDMHKGSAGHSFKVMENHEKNTLMPKHRQGMIGISIDELQNTWGLETPNHIKIDVDGIEGLIIDGASETLKKPQLKTILIEITHIKEEEKKHNEIIDTILKSGFILKAKGKMIESEKSIAGNYIFVRK